MYRTSLIKAYRRVVFFSRLLGDGHCSTRKIGNLHVLFSSDLAIGISAELCNDGLRILVRYCSRTQGIWEYRDYGASCRTSPWPYSYRTDVGRISAQDICLVSLLLVLLVLVLVLS